MASNATRILTQKRPDSHKNPVTGRNRAPFFRLCFASVSTRRNRHTAADYAYAKDRLSRFKSAE